METVLSDCVCVFGTKNGQFFNFLSEVSMCSLSLSCSSVCVNCIQGLYTNASIQSLNSLNSI